MTFPVARDHESFRRLSGDLPVLVAPTGWQPGTDALDGLAQRFAAGSEPAVYADARDSGAWLRLPDWSPERLRHQDYVVGPLLVDPAVVAATSLVSGEGWHHSLLLALVESGVSVGHLAEPIGSGGQPLTSSGAVVAHLQRLALPADVTPLGVGTALAIRRLPKPTSVSIVIPTRGSCATVRGKERLLVQEFAREVVAQDPGVDLEWIIVSDVVDDRRYLADLRELLGDRLRVIDYPNAFNFAEKINLGILASNAEIVAVLNDDLGVITPRWLEHLVALAQEPSVGAVGCVLQFADSRVQHAGQVFHRGREDRASHVAHAYGGWDESASPRVELLIDREVSGVTGACLVQRREVWWRVGGWCEEFPGSYNDVDLCLKVRREGLRVVVAGSVRLNHFESSTRNPAVHPWERDLLDRRWAPQLAHEGFTFEGIR